MKRWLLSISALIVPLVVQAGGSFYLSDIQPLLKQQPQLWLYVSETMEIAEVGTAPRISTGVNKELSGIRIAPYLLQAKPKGAKGPPVFEIEIQAQTKFYDAGGKEVSLEKAVDYKEVFTGVRIRQILIPEPTSN